jgi:hypothetical protein
MALPTMRGILGDEKAFAYFEGSLKESREQHPFLGRSYPESAASFAAKFAEGAIGKSGRKISVKGLQAVDIRLHILPAPRQPRLPRLYIGTIPGNGRIDRYYTG